MKISINIDSTKVANFTEGARQELRSRSKKMIEDLIDEACRIEAARRGDEAQQEITQTDVMEGARLNRIWHRPKKKGWQCLLQGLCPAFGTIAGFIFNKDSMESIIVTMIIIVIVTALTIYLIMEENRNEQH